MSKTTSLLYHLAFCRNRPKQEAAFSTKSFLNSSSDLFFVAAARNFMVSSAISIWLFFLSKYCFKRKPYQAGSCFPRYHDSNQHKVLIVLIRIGMFFANFMNCGKNNTPKTFSKDMHEYYQANHL